MDCAFDDDWIIMITIVDFANLVFYIEKNSLLLDLSPHTILTVGLSNFNLSCFMMLYDVPNMDCASDGDRTIMVDMVDFAIFANLVY